MTGSAHRVVLVTGLSGAGKSSIMHALEDLGYAAVDNPPLPLIRELVAEQMAAGSARLAIGVDARSAGFAADQALAALARLRENPELRPELVFAHADETALLCRYTASRRPHPLAPDGRVRDGIAAELAATLPLRRAADLVIDTSDMTLADLRRTIERHFAAGMRRLVIELISFSYAAGLPREADLVLDARFLRNPHYDLALRPFTGTDPQVAAYIAADPDYLPFLDQVRDLLGLLLRRFVQEGKKYLTVAIGCTGGRHRSVHLAEKIAAHLSSADGGAWRVTVTHRELLRDGWTAQGAAHAAPVGAHVQAQEA